VLGGQRVSLPARRGAILPIEWRPRPGVVIHYSTSEIVEVNERDGQLTLKTDPAEFFAEVSLTGYRCDDAMVVQRLGECRVKLHGANGRLELTR
jgi:hypothetical protein